MREIKFRLWDKQSKKMIYNDNLSDDIDILLTLTGKIVIGEDYCGACNQYKYSLYDEAELMEYTGLKDKNGKEIYEGDICIVKVKGVKEFNTSIVFENGCYFTKEKCKFSVGDLVEFQHIEVIGNIYENPELLND